jgi:hypothetical protein
VYKIVAVTLVVCPRTRVAAAVVAEMLVMVIAGVVLGAVGLELDPPPQETHSSKTARTFLPSWRPVI